MICSNVYIISKFTFHVFILWSWNVLFSLLASPFIFLIFCCCFSFFFSLYPWQFWWIDEEMQTYILMEKKKYRGKKLKIWVKGFNPFELVFSSRYYIIVFIWMITWIAFFILRQGIGHKISHVFPNYEKIWLNLWQILF